MPVPSPLPASWNSGPNSFSTWVLSQRSTRARPISTSTVAGLADAGWGAEFPASPRLQAAGAAIHERLGQPLVRGIGQPVLDRARHLLPMLGIGQPVRTVGREGPGPDMGNAI